MKAMVIRGYGGPEVFEIIADVKQPEVQPGYVLVKVFASSINPIETKIRSGLVPAITPSFPAILNADFSGEIVALGDNVPQWNIGDEVFGCAGGVGPLQGALADYMLVDSHLIAKKPPNIDHATAALFPPCQHNNGLGSTQGKGTCQHRRQSINTRCRWWCRTYCLQLAKEQGAIVYGTVRSQKQEIL